MFAGVKNQMSGWLSGGIPGLSRGAGAAEGETPAPTETEDGGQVPPETEAPGEQIKDDDASRWVSEHMMSTYVSYFIIGLNNFPLPLVYISPRSPKLILA